MTMDFYAWESGFTHPVEPLLKHGMDKIYKWF